MLFSTSALLALPLGTAYAATWQVSVGANNALTYTPSVVMAQPGDMVQFNFLSQNHTVTSGDATQGCTPDGKFNSAFVPVPPGAVAGGAAPAAAAPAAAASSAAPAAKAAKGKKVCRFAAVKLYDVLTFRVGSQGKSEESSKHS